MREPGGLPSMGLHRVGHNWSNLAAADTNFKPFIKLTDEKTKCKISCITIKLLKDNIGKNLDNIGYGNGFLDTTIKACSFSSAKDNVKGMKR